jgi:hypothetical protein
VEDLINILNGHGFEIKIGQHPDEINGHGYYHIEGEGMVIGHWSMAAANTMKVSNVHGFYCDGFRDFSDFEGTDTIVEFLTLWTKWFKNKG